MEKQIVLNRRCEEIYIEDKDVRMLVMDLRIKNNVLSRQNFMLVLISLFSTLVASIMLVAFFIVTGQNSTLKAEWTEATCNELETKLTYSGMEKEYEEMVLYVKECEVAITSLYDIAESLTEQCSELAQANDTYYEELLAYQEREELFDKYEYCLVREDGTRTDITYEQIEMVEDLCVELNVDTDLVFSIVMVESSGQEDATSTISTARGYGQFLDDSGEYVYETIMGAGEYSHDYAYDGDTNLSMMVYYLNYLYKIHGNNLYDVIKQYRGETGSTLYNYIWRIDQYLQESGKSVESLNYS